MDLINGCKNNTVCLKLLLIEQDVEECDATGDARWYVARSKKL